MIGSLIEDASERDECVHQQSMLRSDPVHRVPVDHLHQVGSLGQQRSNAKVSKKRLLGLLFLLPKYLNFAVQAVHDGVLR
jgi:hypothetical protein